MSAKFAVNWDYRCPFARNAHEHILAGLEAGDPWQVEFRAFSLNQVHVEEGQPAVWDEPDRYPGLLANLTGIVVRDRLPAAFPTVHRALFAARHEHAMDTRKRDVVEQVLKESGVDAAGVLSEVDDGWPLETLRKEHTSDVDQHNAFGVPTFIVGDRAVFVRLMHRPGDDTPGAITTINRVLDLGGRSSTSSRPPRSPSERGYRGARSRMACPSSTPTGMSARAGVVTPAST
jgi:hypothetical protein